MRIVHAAILLAYQLHCSSFYFDLSFFPVLSLQFLLSKMGHLSTPGPDTGFFATSEVSTTSKDRRISRTIAFYNGQYSPAPFVRTGLNAVNVDAKPGDNIRLSASIENVTADSMDIAAETWSNSILNEATLTWLEHKEDAKDIQTGWWQAGMGANGYPVFANNRIFFNTPFEEPPFIVVWLHYLDLRPNGQQWRVHTYATNVAQDAFTLNVESWSGSQVYKAGVTWIACKKGKLDLDAGRFASGTQRGQRQPQKTQEIQFSNGKFIAPPTVLSGLSMIDHTTLKPLKIASVAKNVTTKGFTWSLETDSEWTCSAEYIAIGQRPSSSGGEATAGTRPAAQLEIKDDREIQAQRDDWIVQRAKALEQLRTSLSEWEDNLKKREATIEEAQTQRSTAVEVREAAAKEREAAIEQREAAMKQREAVTESRATAAAPGEHTETIQQLQQENEQLRLQVADAASKRAPMRPSRAATVETEGEEDTVESALPRPPIQPPARELPAGNLNWGFDPDLLARFNQGMAGRNLMRPSRREREEGAAW